MARKKQETAPANDSPINEGTHMFDHGLPQEPMPEIAPDSTERIAAIDVMRDQAVARLGADLVGDYLKHGYTPQEAILCEDTVTAIRTGKRAMSAVAVDVGARLCSIKDVTKHGDWTYFVTERAGMSERTARNFMIAARACAAHPALLDNLENIPAGILYQLDPGNIKQLAAINKVAASREVEGSDLASVKRETRPASEVVDKPGQPAPWDGEDWGIPADKAGDQLETEISRWAEFTDLVQAGITYRAARGKEKSGFARFVKLLAQEPGNDEDTRLSMLRIYLSGIYMILAGMDNEPEPEPVDNSEVGSN